ncbi:MAG TPA: STAS domain-containing protein [Burkholderiaceae bacterium]
MVFEVGSAVTVANAKTIMQQGLAAIADGQTVIDLAPLTSVDSSTVAVLLAWQRAAHLRGTTLTLQNIPSSVQSLASLYGVTELLLSAHRH